MKTLIIYDNKGKIWTQMTGDYILPDGLPYIETEIPVGYYAKSVDTVKKESVLERLPETDAERIANLESAVLVLMDANSK